MDISQAIATNAQIQNGKILRTRVGDKFRYDLVLTIKVPDTELIKADQLNGTIGIDVGFRKFGDTIFIGTVISENTSQKAQKIKSPI